ncbi:MAG: hypothetical protein ABIF01_01610 [Candidatus Micrarchaeota archaeon]
MTDIRSANRVTYAPALQAQVSRIEDDLLRVSGALDKFKRIKDGTSFEGIMKVAKAPVTARSGNDRETKNTWVGDSGYGRNSLNSRNDGPNSGDATGTAAESERKSLELVMLSLGGGPLYVCKKMDWGLEAVGKVMKTFGLDDEAAQGYVNKWKNSGLLLMVAVAEVEQDGKIVGESACVYQALSGKEQERVNGLLRNRYTRESEQ